MKTVIFARPTLMIGAGLLAMAVLAAAAREQFAPQPQTLNGTTYVNGGIGKEEKAAMRGMAGEYPLRITFSQRDSGELLANVPITIFDAQGKSVFELSDAGPMLFVKLPQGKYQVRAIFEGLSQVRQVELSGSTGRNLYFHWKGPPRTW